MAIATGSSLVDPEVLGRLHNLSVCARTIVEGLRAGAHRSPLKGQSVDFSDHRAYVPGDDLRHLDWKVLGRRDRLVIKRYEAELDLGCTLAVDGSGSMAYRGTRAICDKYRYAAVLASCLAYLVLREQDRAGLVLFADHALHEVRPAGQGQLDRICRLLEGHTPAAATTAPRSALAQLAAPASHRGLVVLLTDALVPPDDLAATLARLRHRGHDVALLWILDPDELDLEVATVSRFDGLEGDGSLTAEPKALRRAYQAEVAAHRLALEGACRASRVAFVPGRTDEPFHLPLNRLLVALQRD